MSSEIIRKELELKTIFKTIGNFCMKEQTEDKVNKKFVLLKI
jgi:hypothetical protein